MRETNLLISCRFYQQLSGLNLLKFNPGKAGHKQPQKQQQGDEKKQVKHVIYQGKQSN